MSTIRVRSDIIDKRMDEELDMDTKESIADEVFKKIVTSIPKINKSLPRMNQSARRKVCGLPRDHCGPIPDVPVGTSWKYRLQVSESGVHRPIVAGIHGREGDRAYSIVLSGVYEEDKDFGEYFLYSGCGGKEKDKTKRLGPQVFDQELKRHNLALARCLEIDPDDVHGADAGSDWRKGKPVRVVRKYSLGKYSEFAPKEGYRYDGIYKVVKYYPVINRRNGLRVWTYELRRDDPSPAPWTDEGRKNIENLNLKMILPEDDYICSKVENNDTFICSRIDNKIILKRRPVMPQRYPKKIKCTDEDYESRRRHTLNESGYNLRLRPPTEEAATAFDVDIKPDISGFNYASGADIPYASSLSDATPNSYVDIKPNIFELNRRASEFSTPVIDIEEDIKPDIRILEAMVAKQHSYVENNSTEHSFHSPVIKSIYSLGSEESSMLPYHTASLCEDQNVDDDRAKLLPNLKICNVSSRALNCEPNDECKIPSGLLESNLISPSKKEQTWNIPVELHQLIEKDLQNKSVWDYLKTTDFRTMQNFLDRVKIMFSCPCCSNLVKKPVTIPCQHIVCSACLVTNFENKIFTCPYCRRTLAPDTIQICNININLSMILDFLFPEELNQYLPS